MNLATYLKTNRITQSQFASDVGITQGALSKLCNSDGDVIAFDTALRIEKATGGAVPVTAWRKFAALAERATSPYGFAELPKGGV